MAPFYGKYRGKVLTNRDPMGLNRLQVGVPAVSDPSTTIVGWAYPCMPYAGPHAGFDMLPPVGANVWIEYEGGDATRPIWSGCFWDKPEDVVKPALPEVKVLQSEGVRIVLNDTPGAGGLTLEIGAPITQTPCRIVLDAQGIELSVGASVLRLTPQGIDLSHAISSLKMNPLASTLAVAGAASMKVATSSAEMQMGAASVKLSPVAVNINNGALEVT